MFVVVAVSCVPRLVFVFCVFNSINFSRLEGGMGAKGLHGDPPPLSKEQGGGGEVTPPSLYNGEGGGGW